MLDPQVLETERVNGFLNGLSTVSDAKGIILPNVKYWDESKNSYVSGWNNPDAVTDQSIRRVGIDLGDGKTRYFRQIAHTDGTEQTTSTGMKATAWEELDKSGKPIKINGKQEIQISFTGYLGDQLTNNILNRKSDPETRALSDVIDGKLNPQALEAAEFTHNVIRKMGGKGNISNIIYGSHSLGAGNALAAHIVSDLEGIPTKTAVLIEPVAASIQVNKLKSALNDPSDPFYKKLLELNIAGDNGVNIQASAKKLDTALEDHVVSIRAIVRKDNGEVHGSAFGQLMPGQGLIAGLAREYLRRSSGADILSGGAHPDNAMVGKAILQDITDAPEIPTTSTIGKTLHTQTSDPTKKEPHTLATAVNDAKSMKFFIASNLLDADEIHPPEPRGMQVASITPPKQRH